MEHVLYTWGSGEVLESLFNAIATLINGKTGSLYHPLIRLGLMVGLLSAVLSSLQGNLLHGLMRWFLPVYVTITLLFAPTTEVLIRDQATGGVHKINNVPWGLGAFASLVSTVSYNMTKNIETVFSLPDDLKYHQTGAMLASNLIAGARTFHMTNTEIAETFKDFVSQCVVYDVLLGTKYTMDDLKNSADIWELVKTQASPARAFTYRESGKRNKGEIVTCQKGIERLDKLLKGQVGSAFDYFGTRMYSDKNNQLGSTLLKTYMPVSYKYMAKMSGAAEALMQQQLMIYTTIDAIDSKATELGNAPNFALRRAYLQQRANQENVAGLAQKTMLAMKNVMEALIYAAFMFVLPLAMLPKGWRFIGNWAGMVLWVQMWAPLYAILNFIMNVSAKSKGVGAITMAGGITIANSVGFSDLHADMAAQAGYLSLSVGALGYALVKGGASSFMNMVVHLTNPMVSAAGRATEDMLSGNYSFGNVNLGNVQASNMSFGQQMFSPSHTSGSINQNDGVMASTTAADGSRIVNVAGSKLRQTLQWGESTASSLTEQASQSISAAHTNSRAKSDAVMDALRTTFDQAHHKAQQSSYGSGVSKAEQASAQQSFNKVDSIAQDFADEFKISRDEATQLLGRASLQLSSKDSAIGKIMSLGIGLSGSLESSGQATWSGSNSKAWAKAQKIAESASFQAALQDSLQYSQDQRFNAGDEKGQRYAESISASLDKSQQHRDEEQASLQRADSFNNMAAWVKQNSSSINADLTQEFVDWLPQQALPHSSGAMGRSAADYLLNGDTRTITAYQSQFLQAKFGDMHGDLNQHQAGSPQKLERLYAAYSESIGPAPQVSAHADQVKQAASHQGLGTDFDKKMATNQHSLTNETQGFLKETKFQIDHQQQTELADPRARLKAESLFAQKEADDFKHEQNLKEWEQAPVRKYLPFPVDAALSAHKHGSALASSLSYALPSDPTSSPTLQPAFTGISAEGQQIKAEMKEFKDAFEDFKENQVQQPTVDTKKLGLKKAN